MVVVGYGTQRKKDVTGSVASISAASLQEVPAPNVVEQLKGRIAGLDITSTSTAPGAVARSVYVASVRLQLLNPMPITKTGHCS